MPLTFIVTEDGSHTVGIPEQNVTYHSTYGAISESKHIYIEAGLQYVVRDKKKISILEVGFGTGLNALLTLIEAQKNDLQILYDVVELHPLDSVLAASLNYLSILGTPGLADAFKKMHDCAWGTPVMISENFLLKKINEDIRSADLSKNYQLLYFDAFDPSAQPELWTADVFKKMYDVLDESGVLVTYSSKGEVRKAMKNAGFNVSKLAGPRGKREITHAVKL
jgi:tRNA U34 5-methylaminomethyl-2-thiouridine-forming methyltransferase MnmC